MNCPLSPYTSTDAVRGCLGLTDNEVTDQMLVDQQLGLELEVDLNTWVPTYETIYTTGRGTGATAEEKLQASYLTLYAQWFMAAKVAHHMHLAIPQLIGDGKSEMRRVQQIDFEALAKGASGRALHYKELLSVALGAQTQTPSNPLSVSNPDYDPVTHT